MSSLGSRWLDLVEAQLGEAVLRRGADYAAFDFQLDVDIQPGDASIEASSGPRMQYTASISVPTLSEAEIESIVDSIVAETERTAAVLDGDWPSDLDLLAFDPDQLVTSCTCTQPDPGCKHVGALAHLVADAITDEPFDLLHLRGVDRNDLIERITARRRADEGTAAEPINGHDTDRDESQPDGPTLTWSTGDGELPADRSLAAEPGRLPPFPTPPPASASFTETGLRMLADDGARRAHELLRTGDAVWLGLDPTTDLVRRAADLEDAPEWKGVVERADTTSQELRARVEAWRTGGAVAVAAQVAPAETVADPDDRDVQWRRTHDDVWVRFTKVRGRWLAERVDPDGPTQIDEH